MTHTTTAIHQLTVERIGPVPLTVTHHGEGLPVLLLHGGAGPQSVAEFAGLLSQAGHVRVLAPVHPGFGGTPRPPALDSVAGLAALYLAFLDELDLTDVTLIGNSIGGWIAAEMALSRSARIARMVLLDPTGIHVDGHPVADVSTKTLPEILALTYHNAAPFLIDLASLPPTARQIAAGNMSALSVYGRRGADPTLLGRLPEVAMATTVLWGKSDRIVDVDYGRAYAAAIPGASFDLLAGTGHAPQVETPEQVVTAITGFLASTAAWAHDYTENTVVSPGQVWAALRDLYTGVKLNDAGDDIVLHGPFAVDTALTVTPHGADFVVDCLITELVDGQVYAYRSNFNGLYLTSRHTLTPLPGGGTRITQHSQIAGPRAETAGLHIGPRITQDRVETMQDLITAAAAKS